ncbi:helix-turn-helix domain-containing protein [Sphaerochaeta sp.]|uniref:helix-turn-helix domain-containing protein n=1 Tax=Sphaerochaeta sp. TaxID=1972642 RepID=UPI003D0AE890
MKQNLIDYILVKKSLKQADLAKMLGISRAQISKWKSGESIPSSREEELMKIAGLPGHDAEWAMFVESDTNNTAWIEYFYALFDKGFIDYKIPRTISDEAGIYVPQIVLLLLELGFEMPQYPPTADLDAEDDKASELTYLISELLESFAIMSEWCDCYLPENDNNNIFEACLEIYGNLVPLSAGYIDRKLISSLNVASEKVEFCSYKAKMKIQKLIKEIYTIMHIENIPVVEDYFVLINSNPYDLDDYILFDHVVSGETLEDNLPYFERALLKKVQYTNELLETLIEKFEEKRKDD